MTYRNFVYLASTTFLVLCGSVAYLCYSLEMNITNTRSFAIQKDQEKLMWAGNVEGHLEDGDIDEARVQLRRIRRSALVGAVGKLRYLRKGSPPGEYALRVFCTGLSADLLKADVVTDENNVNMIAGWAPLCEQSSNP